MKEKAPIIPYILPSRRWTQTFNGNWTSKEWTIKEHKEAVELMDKILRVQR